MPHIAIVTSTQKAEAELNEWHRESHMDEGDSLHLHIYIAQESKESM